MTLDWWWVVVADGGWRHLNLGSRSTYWELKGMGDWSRSLLLCKAGNSPYFIVYQDSVSVVSYLCV